MELTSEYRNDNNDTVEIIGPFRGDVYRLSVNGCRLYKVELTPMAPPENWDEDSFFLKIDGRFAKENVSRDEIKRWGYILANAMAVSAGYTHHGPDSQPMNKHSVQFTKY